MRRPRAILGIFAASALTVVSLCSAPAASADTGLQNAGSSCYMTEVISDWEADFQCDFAWTGGTAPYTVSTYHSPYSYTWTQVNGETATVYGECRPGRYVLIRITVTDATGASISDSREFTCTGWY